MSESVDDLANARSLALDTPAAASKIATAAATIAYTLSILRAKEPTAQDVASAAECLFNAQSELVSVLPMLESHTVGSGVVGSPRPASPELSGTPEPASQGPTKPPTPAPTEPLPKAIDLLVEARGRFNFDPTIESVICLLISADKQRKKADAELQQWRTWDDRMIRTLNRRGIRVKHHTIDTVANCADDARMLSQILLALDTWASRARQDGRPKEADELEAFRKNYTPFYLSTVARGQATVSQSDADLIRLDCAPPVQKPVAMILHCPECSTRHIDHGDFATKPHHTHSCQACGLTWRPAVVATVGVQHLPNFKDTSGPNADLCPPPGRHPNDGTWWKRGRLIEINKVLREANARAEHDVNTLALQLADVVAGRDAALRKLGTPPQLDAAGNVVPGSPDLAKVPNTDVPMAIAQLQQLAKDLEPVAPTVRAKLRDVIRTLGGPT